MRKPRAFTLVELLIVIALLGILAAVTVPQVGGAIEVGRSSALLRQLQSTRQVLERYRVDQLVYPPGVTAGTGWQDLVGKGYLGQVPRNPDRAMASGIMVGAALPGTASGAGGTDGWYWNTAQERLYAIDEQGTIVER